jgi:PAS domain S-box-containing protein
MEFQPMTAQDADARHLIQALQAAPSSVAVFDRQGALVFHTHQLINDMPQIKKGLIPFLDSLHKASTTTALLESLDDCEEVDFIARQPGDARYWEIRMNGGPTSDVTPVFIRDVSEREERDRIQRMVLELVEKSLDPIGIARPDHRGLYVNQAMKNLFGVPASTAANVVRIEDAQAEGIGPYAVNDALEKARTEGPFYTETTIDHPVSGETLHVSQLLMAHQDPLDGQTYFSTAIRDVSAARKMEAELLAARRELEALLLERTEEWMKSSRQADYAQRVWRSLVEQNAYLVLFTDELGQILYANRGFLSNPALSLAGKNVFSLVAGQDQPQLHQHFHQLIQQQSGHFSIEAELLLPQEQTRYCTFSVNYIAPKDGAHTATWTISDITAERQAREQLAISRQIAASGRIAARIAHEINNPLAAIKNSVSLIRMDIPEQGEAREYLDLMEKELARVSHIIRQMYGLYRQEDEPASKINLKNVCNEVVMLLRAQASSRDIRLQIIEESVCLANVAESSLRQVLYNIIINAIDASPNHCTVEIRVSAAQDYAMIDVIDRGHGINPEELQKLFEPFYTTKETYAGKGLGLGLPVSLSIIHSIGGEISLEPVAERGTRCRILLPLIKQPV